MQREIEAAGLSTIMLANIPDLATAVSAPRVVGVEHPFGQTIGQPDDVQTQKAVLQYALAALTTIKQPGEVIHLPFEWPGNPKDIEHSTSPPIADYLIRHPWHVLNLLKRDVPENYRV